MKQYKFIFLILFLLNKSFSQEKNNTKLFKTSIKSIVVKNDSINLDQYTNFIIIPEGRMFRKSIEKIGFFKEAMSYSSLVKKVKIEKEEGSKDSIYTKYYNNEKEYLILFFYILPDNIIELSLVKYGTGALFSVRNKSKTVVSINGPTRVFPDDVLNSMINELVDFIRANSKIYML